MNNITLICGVRNRAERLTDALLNWAKCPVDEIIIVDWNSDEDTRLSNCDDGFVAIHRVIDQKEWHLSKCLNFAASLVQTDFILKMDVDYRITTNFIQPIDQDEFWYGDTFEPPNEYRFLCGLLYVSRKPFFEVGGYNERLRLYGYDDTDIQKRLIQHGLTPRVVNYDKIYHVSHEERQQDNLKANRLSSEQQPWSAKDHKAQFEELEPFVWREL